MKTGKLAEAILKRSVIQAVNTESEQRQWEKTGVGKDAGFFGIPGSNVRLAAACAVEEGNAEGFAALAVLRACNSLAAAGGLPAAVTIQTLFPAAVEEEEIRSCMAELLSACRELCVSPVNGHTQIGTAASRMVSVTAMGAVAGGSAEEQSGGRELVMTKFAGMSASALLAIQHRESLQKKYNDALIDKAAAMRSQLSVLPEAKLLWERGIREMHDVSSGGVLGAVWELCERRHTGVELELKKIPIRQETVEISEFFDLNPYQMRGDGSLLFFTEDGMAAVAALERAGIPAAIIGRAIDGNDRILRNEEEVRFLEPNRVDDYDNSEWRKR